jgi:RND family efflux transporter MFP subunit
VIIDEKRLRRENHMSMKLNRSTRATLAALSVAFLAAACGGGEGTESADAAVAGDPAGGSGGYSRIINVEVMEIVAAPFTEVIRLTGVVKADQDVTVSAEESGVVTEIFVDKGAWVQKGQPLLKLDDRVLSGQVDQARAQAELARETWERRKRLWEEDKVGSEIAYLEARFAAEQTAASLRVLTERLARTTVRAPIGGVLDARTVEVGTMLAPGTPVGRIVDLNPAKIEAGVPERFALDVTGGTTARVTLDVFPDEVMEGRITYVGAAVDPGSRTFAVEFVVRNADGRLKPEMVASMELVRRTVPDAIVVPQEALVRVEDGFVAFTLSEDGTTAEARSVRLGSSQRNQVVVESGLSPGDRLVVVGQNDVAAGDRVNVVGERELGSGVVR